MNTPQSYEKVATNPTGTEPAAPRTLTLHFGSGDDFRQLYDGLSGQKDKLFERAAWQLTQHNVKSYLDTMDEVENINDLLGRLVDSLNEAMAAVTEARFDQEIHSIFEAERADKILEIEQRLHQNAETQLKLSQFREAEPRLHQPRKK